MNAAMTALIWVIASFALIELLLVYRMFTGKIDLSDLISDGKQASLSRFQFLIFTFVIAVGILYLTVKSDAFPELDQGILILLGISGASYAVGKSLDNQAGGPKGENAMAGGSAGGAAGGGGSPPSGGQAEVELIALKKSMTTSSGE